MRVPDLDEMIAQEQFLADITVELKSTARDELFRQDQEAMQQLITAVHKIGNEYIQWKHEKKE